jgi:hypothetical protein
MEHSWTLGGAGRSVEGAGIRGFHRLGALAGTRVAPLKQPELQLALIRPTPPHGPAGGRRSGARHDALRASHAQWASGVRPVVAER